ncbi:MAG: CDP-alcohol phosphatidyltransferase family protein [Clostridiales bacterium]|jgi:CDP-diacylglycerol--glycerol-3-phosphate 3-phosphatidyltransferase|nr:CDP-alcohol phosphatidyltransferase family protein [Clostridiales bacterium]MCI2160300.1 CDP-alcohol phosphatidyltransferase family protein [Oscillospiraceae bacterium]MCI1961068.1 CDP-alcohol phosphatidyltransferase family protein [Clostridiales bacterium]MCI2021509.1 CDP-alcohol phosphatidyltransferase family protein [Clostridiales bacterium]MCI2026295.1 CDP-alcohol phosphatidyltransferase family protein [Clostridiales bacterium]
MRKQIIRLLPNALSALRFPLGGVFAYLLALRCAGKTIPVWSLLICFMAIALSDLMDGWISRKFDCQSGIGAFLDVSADSFFILLALIISNYYGFVPIWFTIIVILKLVDFILSSVIFSTGAKKHFVFDFLGRFTAVGFYLLPILVGIFPQTGIIKAAAFFLAITAVCSSTLRWFSFFRQTDQKSPNDIKDKNTDDTVAETVQSKYNTI